MSGYDDFSLGLHLGAGGQIWVSAASRLGHVHGVTSVKPGGDVLVELSEQLYDFLDAVRFAETFDATAISEALGTIAFGEAVVRELFQAARAAAADNGRQLIVRIQASPHLSAFPWELLPDPGTALSGPGLRYLTLSPDAHVVRLSRGRTYPIAAPPLEPPLNLLVILSSPMGRKAGDDSLTFDIYEAKRNLLGELLALQDGGWLNIDVEDRPTMDNLRRRIRSKRRGYHLLHYLGHAEPDLLLLEDDRGERQDVNGAQLVEWLRSCPDLRLVTFAGCETGRPAGDPTSLPESTNWQDMLSLSERAAQGSSPVVLGMQAVLPFRTEWLLTRSLYQALASGNTIVDALRLARAAVRGDAEVTRELIDWAIPALFMNSVEPAPLLDREGTPPRTDRRRSNIAKLEPPTAGTALIGRDVPLRQAVEVLSGRTRERVLLISGAGRVGASELLDRALDEIDGEVSDILSVSYGGLSDKAEAAAVLAKGDGDTRDVVIRANLCAAVAQLLERADAKARDRGAGRTLPRWWMWLAEDLARRQRAVVAIDRMDALAQASQPLRILSRAWLANAFPASSAQSGPPLTDLETLVEHLRNLDAEPTGATPTGLGLARRVLAFEKFLGAPSHDVLACQILAEEAEDLFNQRLQASLEGASGRGDELGPTAPEVEGARLDLAAARMAASAVGDMLTRLVRRSPECRVALVVDEIPDGLLAGVSEFVFPMQLGENTWPETWRWIRRSLPAMNRFGQERLKGVWRKYLGSEVDRWEELDRRVRFGHAAGELPSVGDGLPGLETPNSGLERLAVDICAQRARRRQDATSGTAISNRRRRERPLVVAAAASFAPADGAGAGAGSHRPSFVDFHERLNALAEKHHVGGRVTTTTLNQQDTLAVLVPVRPLFADWGKPVEEEDVLRWYQEVGAEQPDLVLLDFGQPGEQPRRLEAARRHAFPGHRTLQIAAGGNRPEGPVFPAWDPDVLAVGALDRDGRIRDFSTRNAERRKPEVFAADAFGADGHMGTSYSAVYVLLSAILAWTLLPDLTPRGLRRFLIDASVPLQPDNDQGWPLALDCDDVLAKARREQVMFVLRRGRASLQAVVAMTGLDWSQAELTLERLASEDRVAVIPMGRDFVYELLADRPDSKGGHGAYAASPWGR
ncbi:MAG: CHAT domain-containing protein [Acidimicrobiales bacterium]